MGWPKGLKRGPRKPKDVTENKPEITEVEVKAEAPKKERKPRVTKALKEDKDEISCTVDEETVEIRRKLDENTLDPFEVLTNEQIECEFVQLSQWMGIVPEVSDDTKSGRYSASYFPVKGCNNTVWPIVAYIKTDLDKHRTAGYTDKTIYAGCINFLSSQTAGKKKKYGNLMPYYFSVKDDKIVATFVTDDRKNKNFWSEGVIR
jgi:hypothetical protein